MGKGFENYMSKKWFHPSNIDNMKRMHNARTKDAELKKRQQELREQYEREQEEFSNKQLMGDEKSRLGLAFLYNAPAGALKDKEKQNEMKQKDFKFDWEKNADQATTEKSSRPEAKNIRCLKCKRWGHANTDKSCPLYGKSKLDTDTVLTAYEEEELTESMSKDGLVLNPNSFNKKPEPVESNIADNSKTTKETSSSKSDEVTLEMLKALPKKEKKLLLKRLKALEKKFKE